ncbi:MAG: PEP-CTERM sorting domain-containing protein [Pirellulales bacterium]|nr:PEP-CTERM sorting domain-containing protein [Pirellulales bacterium]
MTERPLIWVGLACLVLLLPGAARAEYAAVILADGPVLYYQLNGNAVNYGTAGSAYDGTYVDGVGTGAGQVGQAATFDGVDDMITVPDTSAVLGGPGVTAMTFEAWVNTAVDPVGLARILYTPATAANSFCDVIYDNIKGAGTWSPSTYMYHDNGSYGGGDFSVIASKYTGPVPNNEWHHLVLVGTEYSGKLYTKIYIDGNLQKTSAGTKSMTFISTGTPLAFGNDTAHSYPHTGGLDEIAFYDKVLSQEQIQAHYNAGIVPEPGTVALLLALPAFFMLLRRRSREN